MNLAEKSQKRLKNIALAVSRFWFSTGAFVLATLTVITVIQTENDSFEATLALMFAGFLGVAAQLAYERFFKQQTLQLLLYGAAGLTALVYYFYLKNTEPYHYAPAIRTAVLFFMTFIGSIWLPTIKQDEYAFSRSFIIFLKAIFTAFLFALVLMLGSFAIVSAFNFLIASVSYKVYSHLAAITWFGFFSLYFLSLLPQFPTEGAADKNYLQAAAIPKFLAVLLSAIVVPLLAIYTLILLIYILRNIAGDFWNNNLLAPLLVSYVVAGWFALFAVDTLTTPTVVLFKKYFPPLLFIVTALQGLASLIKIREFGVTDGRYFILLFVIFSMVSSVLYLLQHKRMNWIPGILLGLSLLSILPWIDAVSIGTRSQAKQLENTLVRNAMLQDGELRPDASIPKKEKRKIVESYDYLSKVDYLENLSYLPDNHLNTRSFAEAFGFDPYSLDDPLINGGNRTKSFYLEVEREPALQLDITDGNLFVPLSVYNGKFSQYNAEDTLTITYKKTDYQLVWEEDRQNVQLILQKGTQQLAVYDLQFLRELETLNTSNQTLYLAPEKLTFEKQFTDVRMKLYVTRLFVQENQDLESDFYLVLSFKN